MALASVAAATPAAAAPHPPALGLTNRAHFLARPEFKAALIRCFTDVLGCAEPRILHSPALLEPILAFSFPGGGSASVEFTPEALEELRARKGAWLELRCDNAEEMQQTVLAAGLPQVHYAPTNAFYFAAPGGQVFGIVGPNQNP